MSAKRFSVSASAFAGQNPRDQRLFNARQIDGAELRIGRAVEARGDIALPQLGMLFCERSGGGEAGEPLAGAARQTFAADAKIIFEPEGLRLQAAGGA